MYQFWLYLSVMCYSPGLFTPWEGSQTKQMVSGQQRAHSYETRSLTSASHLAKIDPARCDRPTTQRNCFTARPLTAERAADVFSMGSPRFLPVCLSFHFMQKQVLLFSVTQPSCTSNPAVGLSTQRPGAGLQTHTSLE